MKKEFLALFFLLCALSPLLAQQKELMENKPLFVIRPMFFIDYNFYHWVQEAPRYRYALPKNKGQVLNIIPGFGGGLLWGEKSKVMFSLEASFRYFPFSLDLAGYQGMGPIAIPIITNMRVPVKGFIFLQLGMGIQFNYVNMYERTAYHQKYENAPFMTYVGEIGLGLEENFFRVYFVRFGAHRSQAMTFDIGVKFGLNGSLWE